LHYHGLGVQIEKGGCLMLKKSAMLVWDRGSRRINIITVDGSIIF